jgi:hypothetical protein
MNLNGYQIVHEALSNKDIIVMSTGAGAGWGAGFGLGLATHVYKNRITYLKRAIEGTQDSEKKKLLEDQLKKVKSDRKKLMIKLGLVGGGAGGAAGSMIVLAVKKKKRK